MRFSNLAWLAALVFAVLVFAGRAIQAQELALPDVQWPVGNANLRLAGAADGSVFDSSQANGAHVSGALALDPTLSRLYDSGLALALAGRFVAADPLSRGRYDGDAIEYLAASAHSGLGKLEIGLTDGAAYQLAMFAQTDPKADAAVALEDPRTSFFRDPSGRAVINRFALRSVVGVSSNYAKFVYMSPDLFGARLAVSFTPTEGKQLPFLNAGPHLPGRQTDIWEAALKYQDDVGPVSLTGFGAIAEGRGEHKLPGQEGVSDLSAGLRADYPLAEDTTVSLGGSFRQSNAYGFDINQTWQAGVTRVGHVSGMIAYGAWRASLEYGTGTADAVAALPRLGLMGWEAALGRDIFPNLAVSAGWQKLNYSRGNGLFFNGAPQLKMDAVFLHLKLNTSEE
ncbi:MAG TPA: hypothetical protein VFI23_05415 [Rhizomicrobium sp.]|nr:hypothetical protein [Rhizomicrobium sp.]